MKISTTAWVIITLLVVIIGLSAYIYFTRPVPSPNQELVKASKKSLDSVIQIKDSAIVASKERVIFIQGMYDDVYEANQELRKVTKQYGNQINVISDSLDYYRDKKDTSRFVVACDTLQMKADSLVARNTKLDSMRKISDDLIWSIGRQKDSAFDVVKDENDILKHYDSAVTHQLLLCDVAGEHQVKKDNFLKKLYIGLGIAATVAAAIFVK